MQKVLRPTVIIEFSHYFQRKLLFLWFNSGVFEPHFDAHSRCERRYPYVKGCNSGASQKILWKQVVTCSAHSKKHCKTNLAENLGGGGGVGGSLLAGRRNSTRDLWALIDEALPCSPPLPQYSARLVLKCSLACAEHVTTCSQRIRWDGPELQPFM